MNTRTLKEIAKWMMVSGGALFAGGFGLNFVCNRIDNAAANREHLLNMKKIEEEAAIDEKAAKNAAMHAEAEKNRILAQKLESMDSKAFAKYHAEQTAKADADVMARANKIKIDAESELAKVRMECNDEISKIRSECLAKIEAANKKRDDAIEKFEAIDSLFTNKKEILKAKEALERAAEKEKASKESREELLNSIKDLLED